MNFFSKQHTLPVLATVAASSSNLASSFLTDLLYVALQVLDDIAPGADSDAMQDGTPEAVDLTTPQNKQKLLYCERFVEFLTDLLSQLPTRRFIRTLLEDKAILIKCRMSALFQHSQGGTPWVLDLNRHFGVPLLMLKSIMLIEIVNGMLS